MSPGGSAQRPWTHPRPAENQASSPGFKAVGELGQWPLSKGFHTLRGSTLLALDLWWGQGKEQDRSDGLMDRTGQPQRAGFFLLALSFP